MNADYQRILDQAQVLYDMLEALANKWNGQGRTAEAERLTSIKGEIESAIEPPPELPGIMPSAVNLTERDVERLSEGLSKLKRRRGSDNPPDDPAPEGVPA